MKKKNEIIALFFFFLLFSEHSNSFAQTGWFPLPNAPYSREFYSIYFVNADTGFVSSYEGNFKTTDGGVTWTPMQVYGVKFKFFNHNKLGFSIGGVWKTTDSGSTWQYNNLHVLDIDFPNDSIGYSVGYSADTLMVSFGKTTDGGKSWSYTNILPLPKGSRMRVVDVKWLAFRDELHGFVTEAGEAQDGSGGGDFGYYTSDGGNTWVQGHGNGNILYLHDSTWLSAPDYGGGSILKTDDDFKNSRYVGIKIPSDACGFLGYHICKFEENLVSSFEKQTGAIYKSTDAGETWYFQRCGTANQFNVNEGDITTPTRLVGYVVGIDSQIYKTIDGGGAPFTSDVKNSTPSDLALSLSPNPATGILTVHNAPANLLHVTITNILGETVNEITNSGESDFMIALLKLPAGTYFIRFMSKDLVVTRKMIKEE
jgi:photosystem II stability/assembly factor-like uncharacterized protein